MWCFCFNTQPPEGGWVYSYTIGTCPLRFNTQPPEGGWTCKPLTRRVWRRFQHTAARRRLDGAGGVVGGIVPVSTHSRPKAAGRIWRCKSPKLLFQHTAARRRLACAKPCWPSKRGFQHTAARRRLAQADHHRDKGHRFNTQPPEGGWSLSQKSCSIRFSSPDFAKLSRKA